MTAQFQTLDGKTYPKHNSFMAAWLDMYEYVNALLKSGNMTYQVLETAIWIELNDDMNKKPLYFYDARDRAIDDGWQLPA